MMTSTSPERATSQARSRRLPATLLALLMLALLGIALAPAAAQAAAGWSTQSSETWNALYGVSFASATSGWAVGYHGTILATSDGGTTWTPQSSGTEYELRAVGFASATTGWAVGTIGTILKTGDGGATWTPQSSGTAEDLRAVSFASAASGWAVGNTGKILATSDGGATWTPQSSGTGNTLYGVSFASATSGWAVGATGTILATSDGGTTWTPQSSGTTADLNAVGFLSATSGWAVGAGGTILATTNGGTTWSTQSSGTVDTLYGVNFANATSGWAVGATGTILHYATDAPTVSISGADSSWHSAAVDLTVSATVDSSLSLSALEYSTDGGSTWTAVPGSGASRTLTISAAGTTSVLAKVSDSGDQTAISSAATVKVDTATPTISVSGSDDAWHATPVTLTFAPATGPSGVKTVEYSLNGGATWTAVAESGGVYSVSISTAGENTVAYRATNNAGTVSSVGSCVVKIAASKPVVTITGAGSCWHSSPVDLAVEATVDASLSLSSLEYTTDSGVTWNAVPGSGASRALTISAEGETNLTVRASDSAAQTASDSTTVKIDTVKPRAKGKQAVLRHGVGGVLRLYVVKQPAGCGEAKVKVRIYRGGTLMRSFATKFISVNHWTNVKTSSARTARLAPGDYVMKLRAVDVIGNRQSGWSTVRLTVK